MKRKILLSEDNEQNRYLATLLLTHHYDMTPAESGPLGIALATSLRPDLTLLDIQLPGMDGSAVAAALQNNPQLRSIPIVTVTSYAMAGDREKVLASGAQGYIEKPINPATFVSEIEAYLRAAQPRSSA